LRQVSIEFLNFCSTWIIWCKN